MLRDRGKHLQGAFPTENMLASLHNLSLKAFYIPSLMKK